MLLWLTLSNPTRETQDIIDIFLDTDIQSDIKWYLSRRKEEKQICSAENEGKAHSNLKQINVFLFPWQAPTGPPIMGQKNLSGQLETSQGLVDWNFQESLGFSLALKQSILCLFVALGSLVLLKY